MKLGTLDLNERVAIVAEIGNNHEGNFEVACELVRQAAACGVDAVKFQTFKTEDYVSQDNPDRFARLKGFELSYEQFSQLADLAHSLGVLFISTPFDLSSADFLERIVDSYKISSGDNTFYPLLERVCKTSKPVIISTGLVDWKEVSEIVDRLQQYRASTPIENWLAVLHCVTSYPVPPEQANLLSVRFFNEYLNCTVGYSDHAIGIEASVLSIALGARIVEKHFTLDKRYSEFRDHQLSADPQEMKLLVDRIREGEKMLGTFGKFLQPYEQDLLGSVRRSIVAKHDLAEGITVEYSDLSWVRPAGGLPPGREHLIIGKCLKHSVKAGEKLMQDDMH